MKAVDDAVYNRKQVLVRKKAGRLRTASGVAIDDQDDTNRLGVFDPHQFVGCGTRRHDACISRIDRVSIALQFLNLESP